MMQAVAATAWGAPEVLQIVDVPVPELLPGEVLVRVEAAGVNPTDWKSRATGGRRLWRDPAILGFDLAGVVEAVADGSHTLEIGDRVFGMPRFPLPAQAYAQLVAAPARQLTRIPDGMGFAEAASLPLAGLTALQALEDAGRVRAGQSVLVCGAAGGVGRLAVQIAVALGAAVTACARPERLSDLAALGASVVGAAPSGIPSAPSLHAVVIDPFGGDRTAALLAWCSAGGTLVSLIPRTSAAVQAEAAASGVALRRIVVEPSERGMARLASLVAEGRLKPRVALELPLIAAADAHRAGERGGLDGKIVLRPWRGADGARLEEEER
ncbi:NADP-dependent oxidoreductase [Agrococcus sp. BE272]|uniref:NADP-dependent oxidoreductase n=1 Tax=Agrococcus sp. BE272 TaxID=2817727 RepID=UPI002869EE06|nr:NADP-dependent oxidoreductase [Agrococcus sp. BE272]